jgi:hypothetical protein
MNLAVRARLADAKARVAGVNAPRRKAEHEAV